MKKVIALLLALVMVFALCACGSSSSAPASSDSSAKKEALTFTTGGEAGTYYAFGSVLAQYVSNNSDLSVTAITGNGSKANVEDLDAGDVQLGFCQSDVMSYAYDGTNLFAETGAVGSFSVAAALYMEQVQIVTMNPDIKTVADLKGKIVSIGAQGSGVYFNAIDVLGAYGMTEADITPVYQSFGDSAESLKDKKIDAAFIVSGAPTTALVDLAATANKPLNVITLEDEHIDNLMADYPFYAKTVIPAGTYDGLDRDVTTVSIRAMLVCRSDVPEDVVYELMTAMFDNQSELAASHDKFKELSLEGAVAGVSIPYHPGAEKYLTEQGAI